LQPSSNRIPSNRLRYLLVLALALVAALTVAACGGDDGGDEDPQELLDATFNNEEQIDSGVFDVSFDLAVEGGDDEGNFDASLGGPFDSGEDGAVPKFDLEAEINLDSSAQDFSGSAGVISTGDSAFVNFQDTDYEVPADLFQQFQASYEQAEAQSQDQEGNDLLSSIGVNPENWLTDLSNEGNEDVEGTDTIHIAGQADVPKLIEDFQTIAQNVPGAAQQLSPAQLGQLDQLTEVVETADFDVYTGADDNVLRKLEGSIELDPAAFGASAGGDAPDSVSLNFAVTISELNEPQEIAGPSSAQPLGDLLQQFGIDPSQLGALGAAAGNSGSGFGGATGSSSDSQAFLDCLAEAQGQAELDECQALIE
jgi:hypothetical protein